MGISSPFIQPFNSFNPAIMILFTGEISSPTQKYLPAAPVGLNKAAKSKTNSALPRVYVTKKKSIPTANSMHWVNFNSRTNDIIYTNNANAFKKSFESVFFFSRSPSPLTTTSSHPKPSHVYQSSCAYKACFRTKRVFAIRLSSKIRYRSHVKLLPPSTAPSSTHTSKFAAVNFISEKSNLQPEVSVLLL